MVGSFNTCHFYVIPRSTTQPVGGKEQWAGGGEKRSEAVAGAGASAAAGTAAKKAKKPKPGSDHGNNKLTTTQLFESLSRTVTCTRELISIYMCYFQGEGLNTSLSRLFYLVLYTVVQLLSSCLVVHLSLYLVFVRYQVPYVLDAHVNDI